MRAVMSWSALLRLGPTLSFHELVVTLRCKALAPPSEITGHSDAVVGVQPLEFPSSKSSEKIVAAWPLSDTMANVAPANNADVVRAPQEKVVLVRAFFWVSRADIGGPFST